MKLIITLLLLFAFISCRDVEAAKNVDLLPMEKGERLEMRFDLDRGTLYSSSKRELIKDLSYQKAKENIGDLDSITIVFQDQINAFHFNYFQSDLKDVIYDSCAMKAIDYVLNSMSDVELSQLDKVLKLAHETEYLMKEVEHPNLNISEHQFVHIYTEFLKTKEPRYERWLRFIHVFCSTNSGFEFYSGQILKAFDCCNECDDLEEF